MISKAMICRLFLVLVLAATSAAQDCSNENDLSYNKYVCKVHRGEINPWKRAFFFLGGFFLLGCIGSVGAAVEEFERKEKERAEQERAGDPRGRYLNYL